MKAFWLKRLLALLIAIACLVGIAAAERFVYGDIMDRLTVWQWDVVNLFRIGCSAILVLGAGCALGICIFLPRPDRREEKEDLNDGETNSRAPVADKKGVFEQSQQTAEQRSRGAAWLSRVKRTGLFLTGVMFLAIFMCIPWDSFRYSELALRHGRAKAVLVEALGIILLLCLAGATLHFIFAALDYRRGRARR